MMATPTNLKAFAVGFSLSEGIVTKASQIYDITIATRENGIEVNLEISSQQMAALKLQRRNLVGRTGCGLCGSESLEQAISPIKEVTPQTPPSAAAIQLAISQLDEHQKLQAITGAAHGAAWCDKTGNIELLYEDVGRHNALDKLIGALSLNQSANQTETFNGFVLISSRASYEMVHKISSVNLPTLVAVSAPTSLAITLATTAKINLIGFARPGRFVVYTNEKQGQISL
jgi:FdhD protein